MKAIILAGGLDAGRCPLSMVRPKTLFPVLNRVLLHYTLQALHGIGVKQAVICANGRRRQIESHLDEQPPTGITIDIYDDERPRGTAGCMHDVVRSSFDASESFIAVEGGIYIDGDLSEMLRDHVHQGAAVTLGAVPAYSSDANTNLAPLGAYVIEPDVLEFVPELGFYDFKEQLLPKLHSRNFETGVSVFSGRYFRITNPQSYYAFVGDVLRGGYGKQHFLGLEQIASDVWAAPDVEVSPFAEITGPVAIGAGAVVESGAIIKGPVVIGERALIGARAEVARSVLWPDSSVAAGTKVTNSILTDSFRTRYNSVYNNCIAVDQDLESGRLHELQMAGYRVQAASEVQPGSGRFKWARRLKKGSAA